MAHENGLDHEVRTTPRCPAHFYPLFMRISVAVRDSARGSQKWCMEEVLNFGGPFYCCNESSFFALWVLGIAFMLWNTQKQKTKFSHKDILSEYLLLRYVHVIKFFLPTQVLKTVLSQPEKGVSSLSLSFLGLRPKALDWIFECLWMAENKTRQEVHGDTKPPI